MNWISSMLYNLAGKLGGSAGASVTVGTKMQSLEVNGVTGDPSRIATTFTCAKVICDNFSRMPIATMLETSMQTAELTKHRIYNLLRYRPNNFQNAQQFWSTIEYHRTHYGNGFARIVRSPRSAYPVAFQIIHPSQIDKYDFINGDLIWTIRTRDGSRTYEVNHADMLHFRGMSEDGIIGLSPLVALARQTNINERGGATLDNFHKNNAVTPKAVEYTIPEPGPSQGKILDQINQFREKYSGTDNAGNTVHLPPGAKIQSIAMNFADAQLIETMKWTREDIAAAYQVPLFMVDGTAEKIDVEQLTTIFKNNTIGPIVRVYKTELEAKLLTQDEILNKGIQIKFDSDVLIEMDSVAKTTTVMEQVKNGACTPDQASRKLGNGPINSKWAKYHFMQQQNIPLELFEQYGLTKNTDPKKRSNEPEEED